MVTTTFNAEMNEQMRELTMVEMEAVAGGCPLIAAGLIILGGELGFLAGAGVLGPAIDWQGAAARGHW